MLMKTLESIKLTDKEYNGMLEAAKTLKSELPISRVVLFGSKARGTGGIDSDIDLLVLTSSAVTDELRTAVSDTLAAINLKLDLALSAVVISEKDWQDGLVSYTLIHSEVDRDGCEI